MRKKWMVCMIACLMILFAGCNGNTAKETARNDTDKRISFTAGNTETTNGTEKAEDTSVVPETEQSVSSEATTEPSQQEKRLSLNSDLLSPLVFHLIRYLQNSALI